MAKTVVLDPGHGQFGNPYPAAAGYYEGSQMWKLAQYLGARLTECGIKVINTRPNIGMDPDLTVRGSTAGKNGADMFISLHSDAIGSYATDSARGVSAYYSIQDPTRNKQFAASISAAVSSLIGTRDRGALTRIGSGNLDYYGVIRSSAASGCKCAFLIEHGFHTSPSDVKYLISDDWLKKIAEVECKVICEFLSVTNTSTGTTTPTPVATETPKSTYTLYTTVKGYVTAADAQNNNVSTSKVSYEPGEYYVFREYNGMINITKTAGQAGGWINPADNIKTVADDKNVDTVMDDDISTIEYSSTVVRADLDKYREKTVKYSSIIRYGQLAAPITNLETVQINTALVKGLEILKDYLNISSIHVVAGNIKGVDVFKTLSKCACPAKHVTGFGIDIQCKDSKEENIPSKIICAVANKIGFYGIGRVSEFVTHLDIRKEAAKAYFDIVDGKPVNISDIDDYFCVTQADINAYVTGIQKVETSVNIDDGDENTTILGTQKITAAQLNKFISKYNTDVDPAIAEKFIEIGNLYGVRGDIAFCQSCVETGYFKYAGSAVTPDQHNYCGLGVLSNGMKGNGFDTVEKGVEAQIQHLYAYASKDPVPNGREVIDPRFTYVTRGIAPRWIDLNKRWSMTDIYGQTILSVYKKLISTVQ